MKKPLSKIIFIYILLSSISLYSYEIRLYKPSHVYLSNNYICADFETSEEIFNKELQNFLNSGVEVHYIFFIDLYKKNSFLPFNDLIIKKNIKLVLKCDVWNNKYILQNTNSINYYNDINQAIKAIKKFNAIQIVSANRIDPQKNYFFKTRVTATIGQFESYLGLFF